MQAYTMTPMVASDDRDIYAILRDPRVRLPFGLFSEPHFNQDAVTGWCTLLSGINKTSEGIDQFYVLRDKGQIIGYFAAGPDTDFPEMIHRWETGYFLDARYHGRGIMSRVMSDFITAARGHPTLREVFASVKPDNQASQRMLLKTGFQKTGIDPNWSPYAFYRDGRYEKQDGQNITMDTFTLAMG